MAGSSGDVQFNDGGSFGGDTGQLYWDKTNNRLGVGTGSPTRPINIKTASSGLQPLLALDVPNAAGNDSAIEFTVGGGAALVARIATDYSTTSVIGLRFGVFNGSFAEQMFLRYDGNLGLGVSNPTHQLHLSLDDAAKPSTSTWTITSDARTKRNVAPFTDGLAILQQINPISYEYNGKGGTPQGAAGIGIVAQDVESAIPYCISKRKTKLEVGDQAEVDLYGFNSHALTFVMLNAVKELAARVESLEDKKVK